MLKKVRKLGRVCQVGERTAKAPYGWIELTTESCAIMDLVARYRGVGLAGEIRKTLPIDKGQGKMFARQGELFGW